MISADKLQVRLTKDEGERLMPYTDTVGKWTIGVGRNLTDKGIRKDESQLMLANDVADALEEAKHKPWFAGLDDARQGVVVCMIFNLGPATFDKFIITQNLIATHQFGAAAAAMLQSKWAQQVGNRAKIYAKIMRSGIWE